MKLELKNIKVYERMSEETTAFSADIYVDQKKVGYAKNDGQGGSTDYNAYEGKRIQLMAAEAHCLTLFANESNLEDWIDEQVEGFLRAKNALDFQKKIQKACETGIVWGAPDTGKVGVWPITNPKRKISELLTTPQGKAAVMNVVVKVRAELKKGEVIFNTNVKHSV